MKKIILFFSACCFLSLLSAQVTYRVAEGSSVVVEGTSTALDWTAQVGTVQGSVEWSSDPIQSANATIEAAALTLPVESMQGREEAMDKKIYHAFDSETHPDIVFTMTDLEAPTAYRGEFALTVAGTLKMAGQTRDIRVPLTGQVTGSGVDFSGSVDLNMTEWGIEPPTAFFGTLEVGEVVTVKVSLKTTTQ